MEESGGSPEISRAFGALSLEEEKHAVLARVHLALAAECRLGSVDESRRRVKEARDSWLELQNGLYRCLREASAEVLADKATMLVVLSGNGEILELCSAELRSDPEMILAACRENSFMFEHATAEMQGDRSLVLKVVSVDGDALAFASQDLKGDREIVLAAIQTEPLALAHANDELKQDRDLVLASLKGQTRRHFLVRDENILTEVFQETCSDKELLLEAARVDGKIVERASLELRQDKDLLLQVVRAAPEEDQDMVYAKANDLVHRTILFDEFLGASNSVLAGAGEAAPVLTIALPIHTSPAHDGNWQSEFECEVSLLSGSSFKCSFANRQIQSSSDKATPRTEPLTVGRLAELVKLELPAHMQVEEEPARIFLVLTAQDAEGESISVPVTPWDWKRPVSDFC